MEATVNVHIAQGNPATNVQIANQMLGEEPDLVLAITTPSARRPPRRSRTFRWVHGVSDPLGAGLVASMQAPGGNVTGMTDMSPVDRQLELIRAIQPDLKTLGVIYNAGEANSVSHSNCSRPNAPRSRSR